MKTYHFIGGLPRSGSSLLCAILSQRTDTYVTPTSPLLDQIIANQDIWHGLQTVRANPVPDQLTNITRRMIEAMWQHVHEPIIIDKNRGWAKNMITAEILWQHPVKMIALVRDLPAIMASWLVLIKKNEKNSVDIELRSEGKSLTDENRMNVMWNDMVKDCVEGMEVAMQQRPEQVMMVSYDKLVSVPDTVLLDIENFLGLDKYQYRLENIESRHKDDDLAAWGMSGMHTVRPQLRNIAKDPRDVLGDSLFDKYSEIMRTSTFYKEFLNVS